MIKEEKKRPAVRFEGFSDDWEVRKFGDLFKRRMERNNGQFDKTKWISVAKMYYQEANKVTSNNIDTRTYVLRLGDIAFEGHSNNEFKIGRFVANDIGDGVISELFPIYKHITPYDLSFWKYYINLENIMFPKLQRCIEISYTSSNKLDEKFFLKELTRVPALDEQKKIGDYLRKIDMLITLHQRELDQVKTLKKYFLQNMFPAKGETVPKIRLKGFTGDWEQRKLGDIATFINGRAYSQTELLDEGKYRVLRVGNFYTNDSWYYSNIELPERYYANDGDLLYTWSATFGPHIWHGEKVIYHYHIWKIELANTGKKHFMVQLLDRDKEALLAGHNGSTMIHITKSGMEQKHVMIPVDATEQDKIGVFFTYLDKTITLHQRKLDQLQTLKKFMLQNLFI